MACIALKKPEDTKLIAVKNRKGSWYGMKCTVENKSWR